VIALPLSAAVAVGGGWLAAAVARRLAPLQAHRLQAAPAIGLALLLAASAWLAPPAGFPRPLGLILGWGLLTLSLVDMADLRLPDVLTLPLALIGLLAAAAGLSGGAVGFAPTVALARLTGAIVGWAAFAGLARAYQWRRGKAGLGLGDAKLAACAGAWLGWRALPIWVLAACALAFAWIAVRALRRRPAALGEPFAFGPMLALALWLCWLARLDQTAGGP
jgi:leader peptidase (prepilin peptidase)/N-methyltransferase